MICVTDWEQRIADTPISYMAELHLRRLAAGRFRATLGRIGLEQWTTDKIFALLVAHGYSPTDANAVLAEASSVSSIVIAMPDQVSAEKDDDTAATDS